MSRTVIGDFDLEANRVAFGRCAVATGQGLDGYQISIGFHVDSFYEVVAGSTWVRLITHCRSCRVGDRVAALANINRTGESQGCGASSVQRSDRKQTSSRVVRSLRNGAGNKGDASW